MGGPIPGLHRGEGHGYDEPARCGQEASGPLSPLCVCEGDWWTDSGKHCPLASDGIMHPTG